MDSTIVKKWDVKDRSDGIEIRMRFGDGRTEKVNWSDDDIEDLAETIQRIQAADDDERPVVEGSHVR